MGAHSSTNGFAASGGGSLHPLVFQTPKPSSNHFTETTKHCGNRTVLASRQKSIADSKMIALKFIAVVLGAGMLVAMFSGDFGPELLLAIASCLA